MYRPTLILFALLSLILPILAAPILVTEGMGELVIRASLSGSGRGTWYEPGLGSCGKTNNRNQMVVAVSGSIMKSSYCGKTVQITSSGKTAEAQVVDTCPGCGSGDLDMSPALFKHFADLGKGVIQIKWHSV